MKLINESFKARKAFTALDCPMPLTIFLESVDIPEFQHPTYKRRYTQNRTIIRIAHRSLNDAEIMH